MYDVVLQILSEDILYLSRFLINKKTLPFWKGYIKMKGFVLFGYFIFIHFPVESS